MTSQIILLASTALTPVPQQEPPLDRLVNGVGLIIALLIVGLCLIGFILTLAALLPSVTQRSKEALQRSPWRAFFIGLVNYIFLGGISLILLSTEIGVLGVPGFFIAAFLTAITVIGLTGLARLVGERLSQLRAQEMPVLQQIIWGTVALEFATLLPFIGWFLLTPLLLIVSFGGAALAWRHPKQVEDEVSL